MGVIKNSGGGLEHECVSMVRDLAYTPSRRNILVDASVLEAVLMKIWYCILPRHFGAIPDDKAKKCLEKECVHLCYGDDEK